ncbi:dnaJ protein ERDJ2-like [Iris pallida]|uniref:DnaJ protein ERDJ2-like n=1 Tax=Iris pallida TaxID=29817 RepID=A0AAX6HIW3_IRIPA|nr:dnaJ protein ERDJ2-like [Iris pallida]
MVSGDPHSSRALSNCIPCGQPPIYPSPLFQFGKAGLGKALLYFRSKREEEEEATLYTNSHSPYFLTPLKFLKIISIYRNPNPNFSHQGRAMVIFSQDTVKQLSVLIEQVGELFELEDAKRNGQHILV